MTTSEDEGDGEDDEDSTVETNTERCPGQSRLHRAQKYIKTPDTLTLYNITCQLLWG